MEPGFKGSSQSLWLVVHYSAPNSGSWPLAGSRLPESGQGVGWMAGQRRRWAASEEAHFLGSESLNSYLTVLLVFFLNLQCCSSCSGTYSPLTLVTHSDLSGRAWERVEQGT